MLRKLVLLSLAVTAMNAEANMFMCTQANGKTEFSDTPCKAGSTSSVVKDSKSSAQQQNQGNTEPQGQKHRDYVKPDRALSPEETNPPPVRSPGYTKPGRALSPEKTNPPPVRSPDYTKPERARSPEESDPPPVRSLDYTKPAPALAPD